MVKICEKYLITDEMIGRGSFSQVFKGRDQNNEIVAIKCIDWNLINGDITKLKSSVSHEISCMREILCRHIVKFIDVEHTYNSYEDKTYIIMEYCQGGDLARYIKHNKTNKISEKEILKILYCISEAFRVLRKNRITHRDVKPANLFITRNDILMGDIKLGDFTFAKNDFDLTKTFCGSPLYMAPEIVLQYPYNEKVDLWSIGVIIFEMMYKRTPVSGNSIFELTDNMRMGRVSRPDTRDTFYSNDLKKLVTNLTVINPNLRISFNDFFKEVNKLLLIGELDDSGGSSSGSYPKSPVLGIHLRPPKTNPFIDLDNLSISGTSIPSITSETIPNIESFVVVNDIVLPHTFHKDILLLVEIAQICMSRDHLPELSLGIYIFVMKILKKHIQTENELDLIDLLRSVLDKANVVKKFVDTNSSVNYIDFLFGTAKECIRLASYENAWAKINYNKLPFINFDNLLEKAFSILNMLEEFKTDFNIKFYKNLIKSNLKR